MSIISKSVKVLREKGYLIEKSVLTQLEINSLVPALEKAIGKCESIYQKANLPGFMKGSGHNILSLDDAFYSLLDSLLPQIKLMEDYLGGKIILNSFGAFINDGSDSLYSHGTSIHRDIRTVNNHFKHQMVVILIALNDFTKENGATLALPQSHMNCDPPTESFFNDNAIQAIMPAGSLLIFDAGLWHSSGLNKVRERRRALTLTFTRPYLKPQFDFLRSTPATKFDTLSENIKQLIGYYSQVPKNHDEWYLPPEQRFYRRDQG